MTIMEKPLIVAANKIYEKINGRDPQKIIKLLLQNGADFDFNQLVLLTESRVKFYEVNQMIIAYDIDLQQHAIFEGKDAQSILNRAAFQGDLIQVKNVLAKRKNEEIEFRHPLILTKRVPNIRRYSFFIRNYQTSSHYNTSSI